MVAAIQPQNLEQLAAAYTELNPWLWAYLNKVKLVGGVFKRTNHEYLYEPMTAQAPERTVMKATQGGFTEAEVLRCLHGMTQGLYPMGVLYMFPTRDDVSDFSDTRFKPLIEAQENHKVIGQYVTSTDRANLKRVGNAFIYFRSGNLGKDIDDKIKSSSKLKSLPADHAVLDEYDEMSAGVEAFARGRLAHSDVKTMSRLANPTLPAFGIDAAYAASDQRRWHIRCEHCGQWTCLDLLPLDTALRVQADGTVIRLCQHCEGALNPRLGQWVAAYPSRSKRHAGFQIGHVSMPFVDPTELYNDYHDPRTNKAIFTRLRAGLPFFDPILLGCYWHTEMTAADIECRVLPTIPAYPGVPIDTYWDVGVDDCTAIWFAQRDTDGYINMVHHYESSGAGVGHYIGHLRRLAERNRWTYGEHYGPHDIGVTEWGTGTTRAETAWQKYGFRFKAARRPQEKEDSIELARQLLGRLRFSGDTCAEGIQALRMYRREYDEKSRTFRSKPLHDWACHTADALQTMALALAEGGGQVKSHAAGSRIRTLFGG